MSRFPPTTVMATDRILIFDTTLRDGEQGPGFSLHVEEKLALARALDALGVDIMEAGFPIASPKDAEAVRRVGRRISAATRRTASASFGEAIGKPASMMSTPSASSARASASFSSTCSEKPGPCSPSRRVVSKIRIRSIAMTPLVGGKRGLLSKL